ncbi:ferritin [Salinimicrobium terrae]|uniref:ferritin n=1 Tax=Salinimicrobium terrae TaxID=470866 RepID=UPI0003FFB861|nr:ferritin [Salinimicrobium terrae]
MKDIVRQKIGINVDVMDLLNEQIAKEAHSSSVYLAMASWCDHNGFSYSAEFFYKQSAEEREHMLKIFKFINENGGTAYSPQVSNISHEYNSLQDIFETALDQEIQISKSINNIVTKCRKVQDYGSESFLQWFIQEQMEEENQFRRILEMFDLMGTDGLALKFIDERIKHD